MRTDFLPGLVVLVTSGLGACHSYEHMTVSVNTPDRQAASNVGIEVAYPLGINIFDRTASPLRDRATTDSDGNAKIRVGDNADFSLMLYVSRKFDGRPTHHLTVRRSEIEKISSKWQLVESSVDERAPLLVRIERD